MIFQQIPPDPTPLRAALRAAHGISETEAVEAALAAAESGPAERDRIAARARALVVQVRAGRVGKGGIDAFLHEYELSSAEGVVLMCLAEALLRIPDADTADRLIRDKIGLGDWQKHLGRSASLFVNASTWALMLTGRVVKLESGEAEPAGLVRRLIQRSGETLIRQAVTAAMRILGRQFVMGRTIEEALDTARAAEKSGYRHSYDMLGEAARTAADARHYFDSYAHAIGRIGEAVEGRAVTEAPSISVKLSALHPRYELAQHGRVWTELLPRVKALAVQAKQLAMGFTIDAEEADRLDLSLDLIEALSGDPDLAGWNGFGVAVQAYQIRAAPALAFLEDMARRHGRVLMIRLVKGAYWDSEVKRAQECGLDTYPVFTRKASTDVNYIACAKRLLAARDAVYPMFATHNALTLATIVELAGGDFEFQRLHGMGEALYEQVVGADKLGRACRVYAPVGSHEDLLAYLVRRLLENGANSSFVNRLVDERAPIDEIVADPAAKLRRSAAKPHPRIPLPRDLWGPGRRNSRGRDLADIPTLIALKSALDQAEAPPAEACPLIGGVARRAGPAEPVLDPSDRRRPVGTVVAAGPTDLDEAIGRAVRAQPAWDEAGGEARAACLDRAADLLEAQSAAFVALIVREAGRTVPDALDELREAVDFCRYYAGEARAQFAGPLPLPGPTGERNLYQLHGRGVFVCISPWNFPLAIFLGQVAAALAAGNSVVAKPAEQTPLIGAAAIRLLHAAGVPGDIVHLLPGDGGVGAALVGDPRIAGVAFTGSTDVARQINRSLAERTGPIVPLIAETGGLNALIADSSALPEQLVGDVLRSAFDSAGQRCSGLRVLFLQAEIADKVLTMLEGALAELQLGDPGLISTDIGPVIDEAARLALERHCTKIEATARLVARLDPPPGTEHGSFFAPRIYEIDSLARLDGEVFGPILHVLRWESDALGDVLAAIAGTGFGLTLGIHSRIDGTIRRIVAGSRVGNIYVNRNMIGAVVGVQPFGGESLSGTGPKAGGPRYLARFAVERVISTDTTASGGNASLLSLGEEG
jgi:RHH-type proline utilization regulon transcriptional repressor/proline dehydrogenase/delta 1-pyrroline-5-carboxylate dehydrogenase